jgi:hypothetical protein
VGGTVLQAVDQVHNIDSTPVMLVGMCCTHDSIHPFPMPGITLGAHGDTMSLRSQCLCRQGKVGRFTAPACPPVASHPAPVTIGTWIRADLGGDDDLQRQSVGGGQDTGGHPGTYAVHACPSAPHASGCQSCQLFRYLYVCCWSFAAYLVAVVPGLHPSADVLLSASHGLLAGWDWVQLHKEGKGGDD